MKATKFERSFIKGRGSKKPDIDKATQHIKVIEEINFNQNSKPPKFDEFTPIDADAKKSKNQLSYELLKAMGSTDMLDVKYINIKVKPFDLPVYIHQPTLIFKTGVRSKTSAKVSDRKNFDFKLLKKEMEEYQRQRDISRSDDEEEEEEVEEEEEEEEEEEDNQIQNENNSINEPIIIP
ncbi:hypothetical protein KGF54_000188 [Candida jiufengensis]|uniref:uncharacterized protein n=1 Tax=Candida jiufengensis TaxID=497108 RepID=UPI0022245B75|nr:uncharacterized protein KGF54_000188 [Candida jiufengensis]KAI5957260.1 hypothetical protein KGF54_000188 [Candida jiufengensis]